MAETLEKEQLIRKHLQHKHIKEIRGRGLMLAAFTENADLTNEVILQCSRRRINLVLVTF